MPAESQGDDTCIVFVKKLFTASIEHRDSNQLKLKMPFIVRTQRFVMGLKSRKFTEVEGRGGGGGRSPETGARKAW